jgi:hypothetical protein
MGNARLLDSQLIWLIVKEAVIELRGGTFLCSTIEELAREF